MHTPVSQEQWLALSSEFIDHIINIALLLGMIILFKKGTFPISNRFIYFIYFIIMINSETPGWSGNVILYLTLLCIVYYGSVL